MVRRHRPTAVANYLTLMGAVLIVSALMVLGTSVWSPSQAVAATVDLTFRTIDGDKALSGNGVMSGVTVVVRDQTGATVAQGTSGSDGLVTLAVDAGATFQATANGPRSYVGFPVTQAAGAVPAGQVVDLPLYRSDQQWLTWGRTNDHRRVGPATGKPKGNPIWKIDAGNNVEFPPSVAYGLIVYGSYHGFLVANYQSNGRQAWIAYPGNEYHRYSKFANQVAVSSWVENGVQVARVFYADLTGIVGARDLFTGQIVWEMQSAKGPGTGGKTLPFRSVEASPLVQGQVVYVCSRYNRGGSKAGVWALNRSTGAVKWFRKLARNSRSKIGSSPAYSSGRLFVATYDGYVYALRASTGKVLWRRYIGGEFYGTPAVAGSRLYIGNKSNGRMYCLSTTSGRLLWVSARLGTSVHASPALYGGKVYVGAGKRFYALRASNGSAAWSRTTKKRIWGSASILRGVVYYADYGTTYARSAKNGSLIWTKGVGRYSPVTANRYLMVITGKRTIYGYRPAK